jgi:hypothetical protein
LATAGYVSAVGYDFYEIIICSLSGVSDPCSRTLRFPGALPFVSQIESLNFGSRPGGPSQKLQAGLDARVIRKALDPDGSPHFFPAIVFHQLGKDHFQSDAVKRIDGLAISHDFLRVLVTNY